MHALRHRQVLRPLALALLVALALAACGGSGDTIRDEETQRQIDIAFPCGTDAEAEPPPVTPETEEEPRYGGSVVYGVESEVDGYDPANNRWSLAGLLIGGTVFDTLTKPAEDGTIQPYLAESVSSNDDFTAWTVTVRPDVFFHNGEELTAEAVKMSLDEYRGSVLTGTALSNIADIEVTDRLTVEIRMHAPWAAFPQYLASQIGVVAAPEMWRSDPEERSRNPIGTGPFRFEEWVPDSQFVTVRYDEYWRDGLPYLDGVTFRPITDTTSRGNSLEAGDVDIIHTFTPATIRRFRQLAVEGRIQAWESCYYGEDEEFLILFNNGKEPFDDKRVREAFARAVDRDTILTTVFDDVFPAATGPFSPTSPWYSPPPEGAESLFDPDRARELVEDYVAEHGELRVELAAPIGIPEALESMQLTQQYLQAVGFEVDVQTYEFAQYVSNAVIGNFEANVWRQFGSPDPDGEYVWWHPDNVRPVGELSLNIARIDDEVIGEALDAQRRTDDFEARYEQWAIIQDRFRTEFYLAWSANAFWMVAANNDVRDVVNWTFPDGAQGMPLSGGNHPTAQIWKTQPED